MKESTKVIIIAIVMFYLVISLIAGSFNPADWFQGGAAPISQEGVPTGEVPVGIFNLKTVAYNTLDISSSLTEGTNYGVYWYANRGGGWILLGSGDDALIEATEQDGGFAYAVVEVPSGQAYYVDASETKLKNPRVYAVSYEDPDGDGYKEFVFKFSLYNIPKPASGNPTVYFYPYFMAYEKPSINSPSDISGIGTAITTQYIEWYLSFSNEKKAFALAKIELTVNTTDTSKITIQHINIPGVGYLSGDALGAPYKGTSTLTWTYTIGNNLMQAAYIKYGQNQLNKFEFTTELQTQLESGDVLTFTITIYGFTSSGTLTTITDTVNLSA